MKSNFLVFLILVTLSIFATSCGSENVDCDKNPDDKKCQEITDLDRIGFFDIVYQTIAVRGLNQSVWTSPVIGTRELKFETTTTIADDEALPPSLEGKFTYALSNYARTSSQVKCSGGYDGVFILTIAEGSSTESSLDNNEKPPFSVLDPYTDATTIAAEDDGDEIAEIRTYEFELGVINENLIPEESCSLIGSSNCDSFSANCQEKTTAANCTAVNYCAWDSAARTCDTNLNLCQRIRVVRFENGQLTQDDFSRGLQFYYRPKLRTK
jgi:hypothetical protein